MELLNRINNRDELLDLEIQALRKNNLPLNCVYVFYNRSKNKMYIGSTGDIAARFNQHFTYNYMDDEFHKDLREHFDDFDFQIRHVFDTRKEAYAAEKDIIRLISSDKNQPQLYNRNLYEEL